jgi:plasmid stability protein
VRYRAIKEEALAAQLLIRKLDDQMKERLRKRAALNGHSMETEARLILQAALEQPVREEPIGAQIARITKGKWIEFAIPEFSDEDWELFEFPEQ